MPETYFEAPVDFFIPKELKPTLQPSALQAVGRGNHLSQKRGVTGR
jgi:hypothetical protein